MKLFRLLIFKNTLIINVISQRLAEKSLTLSLKDSFPMRHTGQAVELRRPTCPAFAGRQAVGRTTE